MQFNIDVEDRGEPPNKNTVGVVVRVNDVNDNRPEIRPKFYNTEVSFEVDSGMSFVILFICEWGLFREALSTLNSLIHSCASLRFELLLR